MRGPGLAACCRPRAAEHTERLRLRQCGRPRPGAGLPGMPVLLGCGGVCGPNAGQTAATAAGLRVERDRREAPPGPPAGSAPFLRARGPTRGAPDPARASKSDELKSAEIARTAAAETNATIAHAGRPARQRAHQATPTRTARRPQIEEHGHPASTAAAADGRAADRVRRTKHRRSYATRGGSTGRTRRERTTERDPNSDRRRIRTRSRRRDHATRSERKWPAGRGDQYASRRPHPRPVGVRN